jgi:hypothetical protein
MIWRTCVRCLSLLVVISIGNTALADSLHPQELKPVRYGRSMFTLRDLARQKRSVVAPNKIPRPAEPLRVNPHQIEIAGPRNTDALALLSTQVTQLLPIKRYPPTEGLGAGRYGDGFQMEMAPPDTNGAVGETQYVQWVNTSIGVFDKRSGALTGLVEGNAIWKGFGGNCEEHNNGDPIVQFDKIARRWFLAQFSVNGGKQTGYSECIAISTSANALGDYWLYEFQYPAMADYPKVGVWPDGYYVSFNMYDDYTDANGKDASTFLGARVCVYDRKRMLQGHSGRQECFQLSDQYFGLLPSDLDGNRIPARGTPNYFIAIGTQPASLDIWKFAVNWSNPNTSTFGKGSLNAPNATIAVAAFSWACNGTGTICVPQPPKVEGQEQLDSVGDRLMFRAAYRRFAEHDALVINHSVDTGGASPHTAVRWYEIRGLQKDMPALYQQGTFSPDDTHRWIGSVAMDKTGDIVLGYNVSSASTYPGIRIAGRLADDPLGVLRSEIAIKDGTGIQTCKSTSGTNTDGTCDPLSRWGDYSDLTLDPIDDCTFWYTAEYQAEDGAFNWHTNISSFSVAPCGIKPSPQINKQNRKIPNSTKVGLGR